MRSIFLFLSAIIFLHCDAQETKTFDTSFVNTTNNAFFTKDPSLVKMLCDFSSSYHAISLQYKEAGTATPQLKYFNLNFIGDQYLFEKRYGKLSLPDNIIQNVIKRKCSEVFYLTLVILPDSMKIHFTSICPKNEEDRIFNKVEINGGYKYGIKGFEKNIQQALDAKYFTAKHTIADSVYIFTMVVDKNDSCIRDAKLIEGRSSLFTQIIINELNHTCSFLPALSGGRPVHSYRRVYVKLNRNKKVDVVYADN